MASTERPKKLYRATESDFRCISHVDWNGRVVTAAANNIPMLRWPDGRWCLAANIFMVQLFERGLSRKGRGGTLLTYAAQITHLIHFCFKNGTDFTELTDNQFALFIRSLSARVDGTSSKRRSNTVAAIGRTCLNFLSSVSSFYDCKNLVGPEGRIRAQQLTYVARGRRAHKKSIERVYWHHRSFPTPDAEKKRLPISDLNVQKLREAILETSSTVFLRKRRYVMLTLLQITGARRHEIASLTTKSIIDASLMDEPALRFITLKRGGNSNLERLVPITRTDLAVLLEYLYKNRLPLVRRTCGAHNDDGAFLVSQTTGKALTPDTITLEMHRLRNSAGIKEQACAHMFRHHFVTKILVSLIERYDIQNEQDFRRSLIDVNGLKEQIRQWTGHRNIESLETYIHLAFSVSLKSANSVNYLRLNQALDSARASLLQLSKDFLNKNANDAQAEYLYKIVDSLATDLSNFGNQ